MFYLGLPARLALAFAMSLFVALVALWAIAS